MKWPFPKSLMTIGTFFPFPNFADSPLQSAMGDEQFGARMCQHCELRCPFNKLDMAADAHVGRYNAIIEGKKNPIIGQSVESPEKGAQSLVGRISPLEIGAESDVNGPMGGGIGNKLGQIRGQNIP